MATFHISIKSGRKGRAVDHASYISRAGKFLKKLKENDLSFSEHGNLPKWCRDNPKIFWTMADLHERSNGCAYRELELALPSELNLEQQKDLLEDYLADQLSSKPYQYAIHTPTASLGGVPQPHAHLMFNDRIDDGIPRDPLQYFRRYNPKNPQLGGAKKDSGGKERQVLREELVERRKAWADLTNSYLARYGHEARVDHRSNRDRGIEQAPGRHMGQARIKQIKDALPSASD